MNKTVLKAAPLEDQPGSNELFNTEIEADTVKLNTIANAGKNIISVDILIMFPALGYSRIIQLTEKTGVVVSGSITPFFGFKKRILLFLLILGFGAQLSAQHTIWLINKKKVTASDYIINDQEVINYTNLKGKNRKIELAKVFAISDSAGSEEILYEPDTLAKNVYSIEQMRKMVYGFNGGYENHKAPWAFIGGILAGIPIPVTTIPYYIIISHLKPGSEHFIIPEQYAGDKYYLMGYVSGAKRKIITNSLIGSAITLSTGPIIVVSGVIYLVISGGYGM